MTRYLPPPTTTMRGQLSKRELNKALNTHLYDSDISFLSKPEEDYALDILADAFKDDPMFSWMAGLEEDDPERDQKMYKLCRILNAYVNHRYFTGSRGVALGVRTTESLVGCMTLAPSSCSKERTVDHIIAMIKYGAPPMYKSKEKSKYGPYSLQRMQKLNVLLEKRKDHMKGTKRWIQLQSIGVRSEQQWKGYGKKMLQLLTQTANSLNASIYLETDSESNESLYKHFGFHTVEKVNLCVLGDDSPTANFTVFCMRKDPSE